VVDYDVPVEPRSKRMAFYRGLWKILKENKIMTGGRSTQSVWILDDAKIARHIHDLALKYGQSHLYNATPVD
jgi:pSer/pThr/pTyr-binding forkhead associated (FHA) protein